ncbi:restriction endonuclease subunit S, partial [Anaerococcus vaginalis]|uniref:restriction endonuclease subunit S n=2 Tax=Bacteria TaxID=2 RepID=UPI00242DD821
NDNLEKQAKLLYNYWFSQFNFPDENGKPYKSSGGKLLCFNSFNKEIPPSWRYSQIKDLNIDIITGKTPPRSEESYFNGEIPFLTISDLRKSLFASESEQTLSKSGADFQKSKYIPRGSLCVSCIASLGEIAFTTKISQTNQQINTIVFKEATCKEFIYLSLRDIFKNLTVKTGNTFKNMNKDEFSKLILLYPDSITLEKFHNLASPIFKKIENNCIENTKLIKLRDFLLPLLMNGQATIE